MAPRYHRPWVALWHGSPFIGISQEEFPPSTGARYHPALIAQAWMTLEGLFPGRPFLGIGSGEALNEAYGRHVLPALRGVHV